MGAIGTANVETEAETGETETEIAAEIGSAKGLNLVRILCLTLNAHCSCLFATLVRIGTDNVIHSSKAKRPLGAGGI